MKHIIISLMTMFCMCFSFANDGVKLDESNTDQSLIYGNYFDPGHKQKRNAQWGKDRSPLEIYFGLEPSASVKLNFYGSKHGALTERAYMMAGMDFDSDIYGKMGFLLNPGRKNKNRSLSNPAFGWWRLWRYVMIRQAVEVGYKGYFLDPEDSMSEKLSSENYGGVTFNYTLIFDGNFIFDKTSWYFFDHRTARRIRLKIDAGIFFNFNKFNPHRGIGVYTAPANQLDGLVENPDIVDEYGTNDPNDLDYNPNYGQPIMDYTYSRLQPFLNFSIGFAL